MYEDCDDFDFEPAYHQNEDDLLVWEEEQVFQDHEGEDEPADYIEDAGDREPGFWDCNVCGAQNSTIDASCQWCEGDDEPPPEDDLAEQDSEAGYGFTFPRHLGYTDNF